jgi:hypothetical protein
MEVKFSLVDNFLQNGLERLVHDLYLSIFLGVVRGRMTMSRPHFLCYFFHHFILKVIVMISDNLTRDLKPRYNLIDYEEGSSITIGFNCMNGLDTLIKLVYENDNVLMPPS